MAVLKYKYMGKDENYQFNIFINQKACIEFEKENNIDTKKLSYDHYVLLSFIIISMKYENGFFKRKDHEGDRYILLNNSVFLKQLPKIKTKMVANKLALLKDLGYILIFIENNNERYISVNWSLLNKWIGTNKNTHTKHLKKHDVKTYEQVFAFAKKSHRCTEEEAEEMFLTFDIYRYFEGSYDLEDIRSGLIKFITSWKIRK